MIPKSTAFRIYKDKKLVFAGNAKDARREYKRLGGSEAGYTRKDYCMSPLTDLA